MGASKRAEGTQMRLEVSWGFHIQPFWFGFQSLSSPLPSAPSRHALSLSCVDVSPCSLMNQIDVGEPAASSLTSCLCAFPGGFSLLTETGLLRRYLVSVEHQQGGSAAVEATSTAEVAAATPVCLSKPSPEDSFPAGADVPVDHAWSEDGQVLVVLRRSGYTAYSAAREPSHNSPLPQRPQRRCPSANERAEDIGSNRTAEDDPLRTQPDSAAASLGLVEVYAGSNGFHGKVVACCLVGGSSSAATPTRSSVCSKGGNKRRGGGGGRQTYLIAVGGTCGIECHELELRRLEESGSEEGTPRAGNAMRDEGKPPAPPPPRPPPAACRHLANVFRGYPVVALAFSADSGLMAAAAMTGHVKVWEVAAFVAPSSTQQPPRQPNGRSIPAKKQPRDAARRGRGGGSKEKGVFDEAFRSIRSRPGRAESSELPALWGLAVRSGVCCRVH